MGKEVQSQALHDLLSQANNSGGIPYISNTYKHDIQKAKSLLQLNTSALTAFNSTRVQTLSTKFAGMSLIENGDLKIYKKLKTVYGHLLTEDGIQQPQEVTCVCFDKTGRIIYTGSDDGLIKCWYSLTGQLLDSLRCFHAITDLAISNDNAFLAGGSLNGELRIWAREKSIKLCTLSLSNSSINHIKWTVLNNEQYIITCTDETIFISALKDIQEKADLAPYICLGTATEAVALGINKQGFLAAGLSSGKVTFWKLIKEPNKPLAARYLFDLQENQKKTYLIEWSPVDPLIISGSLDGRMVITKLNGVSYERKLVVDLKEKYVSKSGVCNAVAWSFNGRYAIGAITGKPKAAPRKRITVIVVWENTEENFWTIPKDEELELPGNLLGLSAHPTIESIIACGGSNGFVYLINIEKGQVLQTFRETGVWSHSAEVDADVLECVFSPSGNEFAISTAVGTLSFYGSLPSECFQATPVEQFFKADYMPQNDENAIEPSKKICNARLVEHTFQPPAPDQPDKDFETRLAYYRKELDTYNQLETELMKELPNVNEERKVMIRDEDPVREEPEMEIENDNDDDDYIEGESQESPPGESENDDYLSGGSEEDDLLRAARKRRSRSRRTRVISDNEEEEYKDDDEDEEPNESEWHESQNDDDDDIIRTKKPKKGKLRKSEPQNNEDEKNVQMEDIKIADNSTNNLQKNEEEKIPSKDLQNADYHILDRATTIVPSHSTKCAFCLKSEGFDTMRGPFVLLRDEDKKRLSEEKLWIHRACLEYNDFISYIKKNHTSKNGVQREKIIDYNGIREALEKTSNESVKCARCNGIGCTIKCSNCYKWYHGYNCCMRSGVFVEDSKQVPKFRCFECYSDYIVSLVDENIAKKSASQKVASKLSRDWLIQNSQTLDFGYVPQIFDECYYFFQAHEAYLQENYAYFCRTGSKNYEDMPWKKYKELQKVCLCKIINVKYDFPDPAIIYALKSELQLKYPAILVSLELEIIGKAGESFKIQYFYEDPDKTPRFLIPRILYENSKDWFENQYKKNKKNDILIVNTKLTNIEKAIVKNVEDLENNTFKHTHYKNIVSEEINEESSEKGIAGSLRNTQKETPKIRLSYWEIIGNAIECDKAQMKINDELGKIIKRHIEKDPDTYELFQTDPSEIKEYLNEIACPIWYDLIIERMFNDYYRRVEALIYDVELLMQNAKAFNGELDPDTTELAINGGKQILKIIYEYACENSIQIDEKILDELKQKISNIIIEKPAVENKPQSTIKISLAPIINENISIEDGVSITISKDFLSNYENHYPEDSKEDFKENNTEDFKISIPRLLEKKQKEKANKRRKKYDEENDESYKAPTSRKRGNRRRNSEDEDFEY